MEYRLDIYTWPAMCGVPSETRISEHQSPQDAIAHLEIQTIPYHHAVIQRWSESKGWVPSDWEGNFIIDKKKKWPFRRGTNGHHPDYLALLSDWDFLISEVRRIHKKTKVGMIEIAHKLLQERHPATNGWAHELGWEASL